MSTRIEELRRRIDEQWSCQYSQGDHRNFRKDLEGNFLEFVEYGDLVSYRPDLFK
jgi:hypothetical protein